MGKIRIEYPFQAAFQELRSSKSIDVQKNMYKGLLEAYVKFNAAFHAGWLLKELKSEIPMNLRVQLVQMYQKPPSLGFCNAMSAMVNRIILKSQDENSLWTDFAKNYDQTQEYLQKLIKIRNQDAHASIVLNKDHISEIKTCFEIIFNSPFYKKTSLIVADANEISAARIINTKGLSNLNQHFIVIKPDSVYNNEEWSLNGSELCLMPFVLGIRSGDEMGLNYSLVFWNQRNGDKGVFQNYLSSESQTIEVDNITDLSGFPYEDWKKMANPIYLNYLKSKTAALEETMEDEKVGIQQWYEEVLVARKLEKELRIEKEEQISDYDFGSGLSAKLKNVKDRETLIFFHNRIIELRNSDFSVLSCEEYKSVVPIIYDSIVFLFHDAVNRKDRGQYNAFFKMATEFVPHFFYSSAANTMYALQRLRIPKIQKSFSREANVVIGLSPLVLGAAWYSFGWAIGLVLFLTVIAFLWALRYRRVVNSHRVFHEDVAISDIQFFIFYTSSLWKKNVLAFNLQNYMGKFRNSEFSEVLSIDSANFEKKETSIHNALSWVGEISDFKAIVIRRILIGRKLGNLSNENIADTLFDYQESVKEDFAYFNCKRELFIKGKVHSISKKQEQVALGYLNEIFYLEDLVLLNLISTKSTDFTSQLTQAKFNRVLFDGAMDRWDVDRYNFFYGSISFYSADYSAAIDFWSKVKFEKKWSLIARYNVAMAKGALGKVNEYYEDLFLLSLDLADECPDDVKVLINWVGSELRQSKRDIKDLMEREDVKMNMTIRLGDGKINSKELKVPFYKSNYYWTGEPTFKIWNPLPKVPKVFQHYTTKFNKEILKASETPLKKSETPKSNSGTESHRGEIDNIVNRPNVPNITSDIKLSVPAKGSVSEHEKKKITEVKAKSKSDTEPVNMVTVKIPLGKKMKGQTDVFWAQDNLDIAVFRNGDLIPQAKDKSDWAKANEEGQAAWCYYKNDESIGKEEGRLYNWYAVNDERGLAPHGWRIADAQDWSNLITFFGDEEVAKEKLAASKGWNLGSRRKETGTFSVSPNHAWWTSSEGRLNGYAYEMRTDKMIRESYPRGMGFPVLCIKE